MIQEYSKYTAEDFEVWKILFERQIENLKGKACIEYYEALDEMAEVLNANKVPDFKELDPVLSAKTGWTIEVVPGLIPVDEFFELLAQKKFCSSTWLRKKSELDYLEEPDMFHDTFGHIPLLMNPSYASFMEEIGKLGVKHANNPVVVAALKNMYWYSIEFGLIERENKTQIYGAGIISSYGETNHIYQDDVEIKEFVLREVLERDFINSEIQNTYYELDNFDFLYATLDKLDKYWHELEIKL